VGGLLCYGGANAWAWYHLRQARAALDQYHPAEARRHLESCLKIWPSSVSIHLLTSQAARQDGDFQEADRQIRTCQMLTSGSNSEIALEWALLQASAGNVREVEEYLNREVQQNPHVTKLVWESLVEGYVAIYRILDALAMLDHWLRIEPSNLRALELRGRAFYNGKSAAYAARDFRKVLEMDPTRSATRAKLVLCLLDMGSYEEALPQLERIAGENPSDPDVQVRIARCHNMLARTQQARRLLDAILADHPDHGIALRTRGQYALADQRPDQAESYLVRAVEALPNDYQSRWLLAQCLFQLKKESAKEQLAIAEKIKESSERLGDLRSRKLSEQPLDPALHYEMGVLLIRSGHEEIGEKWLQSALSLDAGHRPSHAALAEYYEKHGDAKRAEEHRRQATSE
jgi:tetratricopeptide (TPR) repeat protein